MTLEVGSWKCELTRLAAACRRFSPTSNVHRLLHNEQTMPDKPFVEVDDGGAPMKLEVGAWKSGLSLWSTHRGSIRTSNFQLPTSLAEVGRAR